MVSSKSTQEKALLDWGYFFNQEQHGTDRTPVNVQMLIDSGVCQNMNYTERFSLVVILYIVNQRHLIFFVMHDRELICGQDCLSVSQQRMIASIYSIWDNSGMPSNTGVYWNWFINRRKRQRSKSQVKAGFVL